MSSGIYKWTNKKTGSIYIGKATNLENRMKEFLRFSNVYAGELINTERKKYPSLCYWDYDILMECGVKELDFYEKKFIREYSNAQLLNLALLPTKIKETKVVKNKLNNKKENYGLDTLIFQEKLMEKIKNLKQQNILKQFLSIIHDKRTINELKVSLYYNDINTQRYELTIPKVVLMENNICDGKELIKVMDALDLFGNLKGNGKSWIINHDKYEIHFTWYSTTHFTYNKKNGNVEIDINYLFYNLTKNYVKTS